MPVPARSSLGVTSAIAPPSLPQMGGPRPVRRSAVARAVGLHAIALVSVVSLVFALPRAMPGDPLAALQDPSSASYLTDPAVRDRLKAQYGLDRPVPQQYFGYLADLGRLDLGWSIERRTSVSTLVARHLPWTLLLLGTALLASAVLSYLAGVTAAWHRGRPRDRALLVAMAASRSVPPYAMAALVLLAFAVLIPLFPLSGATTAFAEYDSIGARVADVARHLALPAAALTIVLFGGTFLLVRNTMVSILGEDYMLLARAKGLSPRVLKHHHAGRNALLPFVTMLGAELGFVIGPLIFVEAVFAYPGMGSLVLRAVAARDYPVLEAAFLLFAVVALVGNLLVELAYARLDPRTAS